jgi:hypothetical protein
MKLRQEDYEFDASLGYIVTPCFKKKTGVITVSWDELMNSAFTEKKKAQSSKSPR